ncbi:hypothetical protein GCK72_015959 [Caenorhabditis remanei]|uniref:Domain of unknown function WSN domain-containing protein n=1 Tax=Caenorhabditis remanei TaxID=31234 RepID=A0A6A5GYW9_CAERE|nr:hypothetical protein GCK72_015959 [Caenorhabditis remanei]KAF1759492.1 hypothetical protein GCK72_015959 [Caenorhabditis remanei]
MFWLFILAFASIQAQHVRNLPMRGNFNSSNSHYYPPVTDEFIPYFSNANAFANASTTRLRIRRNSNNDFSVTVDQILKISRVINGIALQQGLTKKSIQSETLITELLNLGSVIPALIHDLKPNEIAALIEEIQSFPDNLSQSLEIDRIEQRFLLYSSMINKIKGVEKNFGIPDSNQYLTDVKKLARTTENLGKIDDGVTCMKYILDRLVDLETTTDIAAELFLKLVEIPVMTNRVESLDKFKAFFDSKVIGGSIFETLTRVQSAVQEFRYAKPAVNLYDTKDDAIAGKVGENIKKLNDLAGKAKSALSTFHILNQLFIHRLHRSGNRELTLSAGFSNGFSNLQLISDDLRDQWVQSVVDGQAESLAKAMQQFKSFGEAIKSMDNSFALPPGEDQVLRRVYDRTAQLAEISEKFRGLDENTKQFKINVLKSEMRPTNQDNFSNLMEKIWALRDQYSATLQVIDLASKLTGDHKEDLSNMVKIIANCEPETAVVQLKTLRESLEFKKILSLFRNAEKELNTLENVQQEVHKTQNQNSTVIGLAKSIGEEYGEVKTYMDGLGGFFDGVDQIRNLKGIDLLGEAVEAVKMFRASNESALSFLKIKEAIPSVQQKMMDVQATMDTFKDGLEVKVLAGLRDVLQDSQTIGSASRVYWSMEKVNKIVVLDEKAVKVIQEKMKGVDPEDQENLDQLLLIDNQLTTVYAQIDGVKKSVIPTLTSDLSSLYQVFKLATTAPGTPMDFLKIGRSVEKLTKDLTLTPAQLKSLLEVKKNLETLDTFGLDFAKHHKDIDGSTRALNQMDLFFADFKINVTPVTTTPMTPPRTSSTPPPGQLQSNASTGSLGENGETKVEGGNWFEKHPCWIAFIAFITLEFCVGTFVAICVWKRKKSVKNSNDVEKRINTKPHKENAKNEQAIQMRSR